MAQRDTSLSCLRYQSLGTMVFFGDIPPGGWGTPRPRAGRREQGAGSRAGAFTLSQPGGNRPRWLRGQQAESRLPLPLPTPQIVIL